MARTKQTARRSTGGKAPPPRSKYNVTKSKKDISPKLSKNELLSWLQLNQLILQNRTTNQILKDALTDIIQSLGSIKEMFLFITKNAKYESDKLKLIHHSISKQISKHENDEKKVETKLSLDKKPETKNSNKLNLFNIIPNECISEICIYIDKQNMKTFKMTCRRNAMVCLNEMNKSMVGIINNNQINNLTNLYNLDQDHLMICNRYQPNTTYFSLYDHWASQYNIPKQNQLLFDISNTKKKRNHLLIDSVSIQMNQIKQKQQYLLLDNRKITVLTADHQARKFNIEKDKYANISNYELIILEYFDMNNQACKVVQYILYSNEMTCYRLSEYIQHSFIACDGMNNSWYNELQLDLNHFKQISMTQLNTSQSHPILRFYQHMFRDNGKSGKKQRITRAMNLQKNGIIKCDNFHDRLITFQLCPNRVCFNKNKYYNKKFDDIKLKCKENMDKFYSNCDVYCSDVVYIAIHFQGDPNLLKSIVQHKYENKKPDGKNTASTAIDLQNTVQNIERKWMKIKMSQSCKTHVLRWKISKYLFNHIIQPESIELFDFHHCTRRKWNHIVGEIKNIYYSVVLYDTHSFSK